ncbi:DUF6660 family protein [Aestuariivivens sediminis]|uniref:DUF6660 family protein n=1 Tax=Aestuariivivens sediminis TaxID=2913557 RepID=UPI003B845E13
MKTLCLILALYSFCLSTIPCCSDNNCNDDIQTEQTDHHSEKEKGHDDSDCSMCSPFLTCGTCSGFVYSKLHFYLKNLPFHKSKFIAFYVPQITDDFFAKIWQPPKKI